MKIAQVSPLIESVPPLYYGGTERVVSYLTEELVRQGHDVTLFASGDSVTSAQLEPVVDRSLRLHPNHPESTAYHSIMLGRLSKMAHLFDIIHFHIDILHFPMNYYLQTPNVTTLHGRLDLPDLGDVYREFDQVPLISISDHQRTPLPFANWQATVYNGVPADTYHFNAQPQGYLAFLGRISPEKGIEDAIEIAIRAGMPLRIAAKVDKADEEYYQKRIKPLLQHPLVEYIGEISEQEKDAFLGNAYAVLFPINWPEPFGLVMIESFACGTPVIAFNQGSVPEVMQDGETGFVVSGIEAAVDAVEKIDTISRQCCRYLFEQRFSSTAMARNYLRAYESIIGSRHFQTPIAV